MLSVTWPRSRCEREALDGGPLPVNRIATADDEWFRACSHNQDGEHEYPYRNTYESSACNGDNASGYWVPVGASKKCEGGYPGLFDMSGNARERIASCAPTADGGRACSNRGGAYYEGNGPALLCRAAPSLAEGENVGIGFRCCAAAVH